MSVGHDDLAGLLRALGHPVRVASVERLGEAGEGSPVAFAEAFEAPLATVSFHFRALDGTGLIELARTEPRRRAIEHFYMLSVCGRAAVARAAHGTAMTPGRRCDAMTGWLASTVT
jgi:DNA-binding transcriptional ArsR family regulator